MALKKYKTIEEKIILEIREGVFSSQENYNTKHVVKIPC